MILFINACVRQASRTRRLADCLLAKLNRPYTEVCLQSLTLPAVDEAFLDRRDRLIREKAFQDPIFAPARPFAEADEIVIAAPYWDLSFPASLKRYMEQINVVGITFRYTEQGVPMGLCRARRLFYVATAGGGYVPEAYGFGYIKALAQSFYGIPDVRLIQAVGLDLDGADTAAILRSAEESIAGMELN